MNPAPLRQHYNLTLGVLVISALAYALSQTMVAPALPEIQNSLGTSTTTVTFVLTAYLLTASVATPIIGRLGDMFGKERLLLITLTCFAAGPLVCALSHSIGVLIAGGRSPASAEPSSHSPSGSSATSSRPIESPPASA